MSDRYASIKKAVLLALALLAPATVAAQTFTAPPAASYQSPTQLVDKTPGDGVIRFKTKRGGIAANRDAKLCADYRPAFLYVRADLACPTVVTPPPVVEPPVVVVPPITSDVEAALFANGEAAIQNRVIGFGFNSRGSIGTLYNVPAPFRTDIKTGLRRLAGLGQFDDFLAQGRAIAGYTVTINGVAATNNVLAGWQQIAGKFANPFTWRGATNGVDIEQKVALNGTALDYDVGLTNRTANAVVAGYHFAADPDQSDLFNTINTVPVSGTVESVLQGGAGTFFMSSAQPGVYAAWGPYSTPNKLGTRMEVGHRRNADDVVQLVFPQMLIQPGETARLRFSLGIR